MSNITELESALSDVFASFDVEVAEEGVREAEMAQADVREIRMDMSVLAGSRPSGN